MQFCIANSNVLYCYDVNLHPITLSLAHIRYAVPAAQCDLKGVYFAFHLPLRAFRELKICHKYVYLPDAEVSFVM